MSNNANKPPKGQINILFLLYFHKCVVKYNLFDLNDLLRYFLDGIFAIRVFHMSPKFYTGERRRNKEKE